MHGMREDMAIVLRMMASPWLWVERESDRKATRHSAKTGVVAVVLDPSPLTLSY